MLHVTKFRPILTLHVTHFYQEQIMKSHVSERVQKYRTGLRASGLRPVQIWVPDIHRPGFAEECRRQSQLLLNDPQEDETVVWLAAADTDEWA